MASSGEYEPKDSRNVTGTAHTKDGRWSGDKEPTPKGSGEYEPHDSRNVTGTADTPDGRWTEKEKDEPGVPDSHPFTAEEAARSPVKR